MDTRSTAIECEIGSDDWDWELTCWLWTTEATGGAQKRKSMALMGCPAGATIPRVRSAPSLL
jgi:hypothetical protein